MSFIKTMNAKDKHLEYAHDHRGEKIEGMDAIRLVRSSEPTTWIESQRTVADAALLIAVCRQLEYGPANIDGEDAGDRLVPASEIASALEDDDPLTAVASLLESDGGLTQAEKILQVMVRCHKDKSARIHEACSLAVRDGVDFSPEVVIDAALDAMNYYSFIVRLALPSPGLTSEWRLPLESL